MVKAIFDFGWQYLLTLTQDEIRKTNNLMQYSTDASTASKELEAGFNVTEADATDVDRP